MMPIKFFERGSAIIFLALNANSSKTVKATDFKFGVRVLRDSLDMTP